MNNFKTFPKPVAMIFFFIGLLSAVCFRLIIIVQHAHPQWVRVFWYVAVLSNLFFFLFRYLISCRRKQAIQKTGLITKLSGSLPLEQTDKEAMLYILTSLERSWENLNYLSISLLSIIAILIDLFLSVR